MDTNFTPLDVASFQKKIEVKQSSSKSFGINAVFLSLIVVTLAIIAALLFILIQKKLQELALTGVFA